MQNNSTCVTVMLCVIMKARSTIIHFHGISAVNLKMHERLMDFRISGYLSTSLSSSVTQKMQL